MTPRQEEAVAALKEHGSVSAAARAMGLTRGGLQGLLRKAGYDAEERAEHMRGVALNVARHYIDPAIADAMGAVQTGMVPSVAWIKTKATEDAPGYSVMLRPSQSAEDVADRVRAALEGLEPAQPVIPPEIYNADLMTVYPLADAHVGMMAYGKEVGEDYDTEIAVRRIRDWVGRCVDSSPASSHAVILDVGDLTHADDQSNQTPRSRHVLDVDTRHFRTLELTIAALAYSVEYALQKHQHVTVRILPGNHNPTSFMAIVFALAERYRNEPRVTVEKVPGEFWVHEFGSCLLAAHHGHGGKPERMVMYLADEFRQIWGRTVHRFLFTAHQHHLKAGDIGGVQWEQLRPITSRDAYAVSQAHMGRAQLQGITFHRERGEVQRVKVAA